MRRDYTFYVYIIASGTRVLYIGVANNLKRRMWEHKNNFNPDSFACKYRCNQLVYYEHHSDIRAAIGREKQLKRWRREKKIMLIEKENRDWDDISKDWF